MTSLLDSTEPQARSAAAAVRPRILISSGFSRFPLAALAAQLRQRQWDVELMVGAYPSGLGAALLSHLPGLGPYRIGRFEDRRVEIEPQRVHPDFVSEFVNKLGVAAMGTRGAARFGWALQEAGLRLYGAHASRRLEKAGRVDVYHVRSAFGLSSLKTARDQGIPIVCDHSFAHPAAVRPLMENSGRLPVRARTGGLQGLVRLMSHDLDRADWVVVNSDFVRETFEWAGFDASRVRVVHAGVEPDFMASIPAREMTPSDGPVRLLFAGEISPRKGVDILFSALSAVEDVDWRLDLVGTVFPEIASRWTSFLGDSRVSFHGTVRIRELAGLMSRAEVFIFPSLLEGSARVVTMAMATGCYVVTTPNSGSIVQDGVHGRLVPPGDEEALVRALAGLMEHRSALATIGRANAELIRQEYLQEHYANRVAAFYREVLDHGQWDTRS